MRAVALALAALAAAPAAAGAARAPCNPAGDGPTCRVWTGRVTLVADGDTIDVDLRRGPVIRVRFTGIQAMELTRYSHTRRRRRGACHAVAATNRLERLIKASRWRVRLLAQDPSSNAGGRPRRLVQVRRRGRWRDVATILLREGHGLWDPGHTEWSMNAVHHAAAMRAAARGRRLYDPETCGRGPSAGAALGVHVNWDAPGNDYENPNGEWVRVRNDGGADVPLGGWWIRDSYLRRFTFPAGAVVRAGGAVTMYVGRGPNGGDSFHWGLAEPAFENATDDGRHLGDGAYLFDPQGDLRAWEIY